MPADAIDALTNAAGNPATARFTCELQGKGVLPSLTVIEPTAISADGKLQLKFPRLMPNKTAKRRLVVRNNGAIPVTARLEDTQHATFHLLEGLPTFTLQPNEQHAFVVEYAPRAVGPSAHTMALSVSQNHFENVRVALTGECFQDDVTLAGLPDDQLDVLKLADGPVGRRQEVAFSLQNHCGKHFRCGSTRFCDAVCSRRLQC